MHPVPGVRCNGFSFTLADQQLMTIQQVKQIIPAYLYAMGFENRSYFVIQLTRTQSGQLLSLVKYMLNNDIILDTHLALAPLMIIQRMAGFAKQSA
jgi:hypothetical protein